jgi:hypothetical protein
VKARRVRKLDAQRSLAENAARIVRVRVRELRSFAPKALDPPEETAQHDMRIAAKRLRYVLEVTGFCFGPVAERARRRSRDLQDILGDLHDCDVMLPRVEAHLRELREQDATEARQRAGQVEDLDPRTAAYLPGRIAYGGLELLMVHLRARRMLLHDRFLGFWEEQERRGTWTKLDRAARDRLKRAKDERRAASGDAEPEPVQAGNGAAGKVLTLPSREGAVGVDKPATTDPTDPGPVSEPGQGSS